MKKETEMKIYRALGVEYFRKGAFALEKLIHRRDNHKNRNYHIENVCYSSSISKFVDFLFYNGNIHAGNIKKGSIVLLILIVIGITPFVTVPLSLWLLKDAYCIMLQRYNNLRMESVNNKLIEREKRKIEETRETYNEEIVNSKSNKNELIKNLKALKNYLENDTCTNYKLDSSLVDTFDLVKSSENVVLRRGR